LITKHTLKVRKSFLKSNYKKVFYSNYFSYLYIIKKGKSIYNFYIYFFYDQLVEITHNIINEAFSTKVITPGVTTTDDVVWWMRDKVTQLGLETWFHPSVDVQRTSEELESHLYSFSDRPGEMVILPGDLLRLVV